MKNNSITVLETIVNTLLHVGDVVVEISRDRVINKVWYRDSAVLHEHAKACEGKRVSEIKDESIFCNSNKQLDESFSSGVTTYLEKKVRVGGKELLFGLRILPVHPDKDKLLLVAEQLKDNTAHKHISPDTDLLLEQQRHFYERILNNISAEIVVLDADYRFLFVNPTAVKDDEIRKWLIGKTDEEYLEYKNKPTSLAERRRNMYEAARNERRVIEWVEKTGTLLGGIKYMMRRIYPVFDDKGNLDLLIGYSLNVTELISAQEELKTSRDTFQSAFHDSGIGMALLSPEGRWLDANRIICDMTGYPREELLQLNFSDITFPEDLETDRAMVKKMLRREMSGYTMERRYISRQGKVVYVLLTLSLVWDNDDMPRFFILQAVDITKKKELENEVNRKNAEMEAAKTNLVNKVNQLEELSYIIAHNLRGPAANIKLLTEALLAKKDVGPEGKLSGAFTVEEGLGFIKDASDQLMNSLASLMKIAEVKLNKNVPVNECDVSAVIHEVTTQLQSAIFEKKASIKLSLDVKIISYPRAYLESILYNFISNALKYNKPDVAPEISIITRRIDDKIQLSVKDNGLGIDMERYGDRMFKLNQVFHAGHDSKGFGLYLTKTQVESLGGNIAVESKLNEGCEFVVTI